MEDVTKASVCTVTQCDIDKYATMVAEAVLARAKRAVHEATVVGYSSIREAVLVELNMVDLPYVISMVQHPLDPHVLDFLENN